MLEAGAGTVSLVFLCGRGARRRPEYGKDVGELPPAKALSAPGSPKNFVHVCISEAASQDSGPGVAAHRNYRIERVYREES